MHNVNIQKHARKRRREEEKLFIYILAEIYGAACYNAKQWRFLKIAKEQHLNHGLDLFKTLWYQSDAFTYCYLLAKLQNKLRKIYICIFGLS